MTEKIDLTPRDIDNMQHDKTKQRSRLKTDLTTRDSDRMLPDRQRHHNRLKTDRSLTHNDTMQLDKTRHRNRLKTDRPLTRNDIATIDSNTLTINLLPTDNNVAIAFLHRIILSDSPYNLTLMMLLSMLVNLALFVSIVVRFPSKRKHLIVAIMAK